MGDVVSNGLLSSTDAELLVTEGKRLCLAELEEIEIDMLEVKERHRSRAI